MIIHRLIFMLFTANLALRLKSTIPLIRRQIPAARTSKSAGVGFTTTFRTDGSVESRSEYPAGGKD